MPKLAVIDREGSERIVDFTPGFTAMEVIRDSGDDAPFAICWGACSCATCHVYVDTDFIDRLPQKTEDEEELISSLEHVTASSRLSCQIILTDALENLKITIAPEE